MFVSHWIYRVNQILLKIGENELNLGKTNFPWQWWHLRIGGDRIKRNWKFSNDEISISFYANFLIWFCGRCNLKEIKWEDRGRIDSFRTQAGDRFSTSSAEDFRQRNGQVASSCTDNSCPAFLLLNIHRHMATKMNKTLRICKNFRDYAIYKIRSRRKRQWLSIVKRTNLCKVSSIEKMYIFVFFFFSFLNLQSEKNNPFDIVPCGKRMVTWIDPSRPLLSGENRYNQYATER